MRPVKLLNVLVGHRLHPYSRSKCLRWNPAAQTHALKNHKSSRYFLGRCCSSTPKPPKRKTPPPTSTTAGERRLEGPCRRTLRQRALRFVSCPGMQAYQQRRDTEQASTLSCCRSHWADMLGRNSRSGAALAQGNMRLARAACQTDSGERLIWAGPRVTSSQRSSRSPLIPLPPNTRAVAPTTAVPC